MRELTLEDIGLEMGDFALLATEDKLQIEKWDYQEHDIFKWLAIVLEELGEVSKASLEFLCGDGKLEDISAEAISVATLALKIAVMVDRKVADLANSD